MSSSAATYLVLITAGLSVTYLSFMMYSAYGLGALKAAAPFIGSISIVFGIAHCLDRAQDAEDEKAKATSLGGAAGAGSGSKPKAGAATAPAVPRRRRVAD